MSRDASSRDYDVDDANPPADAYSARFTNRSGGSQTTSGRGDHSIDEGVNGMHQVAVPTGRRRRVLCAVALNEDEVSTHYGDAAYGDDGLNRSTVCMTHHVIARIHEDARRQEHRKANPVSAIPDRSGKVELELGVLATATCPSSAAAALRLTSEHPRCSGIPTLPPLVTHSGRSRPRSRSYARSGASTPLFHRKSEDSRSRSPTPSASNRAPLGQPASYLLSPTQLGAEYPDYPPDSEPTADFIRLEQLRYAR